MEEIIKYLEEIKEYQMGTVQLARSTEVYKLADKALAKALFIHGVMGQSGQLVCSCGSIKVQTTGGSQCPNNRCSSAN